MCFMIIRAKCQVQCIHFSLTFPLSLRPSVFLYFFLLLHILLSPSALDSSRIEIGLARYPSMLNLCLQGLCANNPSLYCWRKSVAFFLPPCVPPVIATLLHGGMFCMCTFANIIIEQVSVATFGEGFHRAGPFWWLNRAELGNEQHWSYAANK